MTRSSHRHSLPEVVVEHRPPLTDEEKRIIDLHSAVNIVSLIQSELRSVNRWLDANELRAPDGFNQVSRKVESAVIALRSQTSTLALIEHMRSLIGEVVTLVRRLSHTAREFEDGAALRPYLVNLDSICQIFTERLDELDLRAKKPNRWISIHQTEIERRFHDVFHAIEKNAKGAYRIRYNLARKDPKDYYFDLKFKPRAGSEHFAIPVRLMDVIRDLAANARKYTAPGGHFALNLVQDEERIEIAIEDDGCGIPEDELQRVFEFGYRASNASGRPTNGGGFGLTKAILVVHELGGQLTLASAVDAGTKIHISIPSKGHG